MCFGFLLARQPDRELRVGAQFAVHLDGTAVLPTDNLVTHGQAKSSAFSGRFRSNKRLEQLLPYLWCDAGAIVTNPDHDLVAQIPRRDSQYRTIPIGDFLAALVGGVKAIPNEIQ